jgi:hypothetical protein
VEQESHTDRIWEQGGFNWESIQTAVAKDWWWLCEGLGQELRQKGDDLRGFSLTQKSNGVLLTIRLVLDGIPSVVFINRRTASDCVAKARHKWDEETLTFFPDRYA